GERIDAERLGGAHFVQSCSGIQKPDVVLKIILVQVAEVRVQRVAVIFDILFRVSRRQPRFLDGNGRVFGSRRQLAFFRSLELIVAVVVNGTDQLLLGNGFLRDFDVLGKSVLRGHGSRSAVGIVFVVIHQDYVIGPRRNRRVVEIFVARRHADVQFQVLGVQIGGKLLK